MKRILVVTWDGGGNLPPEFSLCRALVERGHEVHVLGHDSIQTPVDSLGCRFVGLRSVTQVHSLLRISPEQEATGEYVFDNVCFGAGFAEDTAGAIRDVSPDVVLVDGFLPYALIASLSSVVPTVVLWHTLYSLIADNGAFLPMFDRRFDEINRVAQRQGIGSYAGVRELLEAAQCIVVFSFKTFDPVGFDVADNVIYVGPLRRPSSRKQALTRRFPERPLVLVGLSTTYQGQQDLIQRLCDAFSGLDVEAIITTGPAIQAGDLAPPENVSLPAFVAHDELLPDTALLITHAGHGTVMAGLSYGVPMLCIPMGRDQPLVAARAKELGVGRVIDSDASTEDLIAAINEAIGDAVLARRCREVADKLTDHVGREEAVRAVEKVMRAHAD